VVDRANQDCPRHAKVSKSHILFTSPRSPMLRSSKGTVQRQPTLDLYAREIDALYRDADAASRASHGPRQGTDIGNRAAVLAFVRGTIHLVAGNRLEDSDDFFASGMDSLQALHAARALNQGLSLPADIEISTIYKNPSILQLTESLLQLSVQREDMALDSKLSDTLKEYTKIVDGLPSFQIRTPTASEDRVVILTGSTGGIGCYLLQILLENPSVSHIYCLNRSSRSATIQKLRSGDRGLPTSFPHHRVTFLTSNLSEPGLGLDNETYKRVSGAAADIIHSAWPVNFNLALDAFRPHLDGVVCLLTLACISPSVRSIFFVSSTSTVAGSRTSPVPEHVLDDLRAPAPMGYAQGKYLAERILDHAARARPGLDIKVARVGQVAGPAVGEGAWNRWEWLPSLVMSSFYLEAIPTSLGNSQAVDWLPIDVLAPVLIELALGSEKSETGAAFFHLSNPKLASWEHLLPSVIAALGGEKTIAKVSFADWLQLVRSAVADGSDPAQLSKVHPAVKLVTFYESLLLNQSPPLEMGKALQASEKLRDVGEIQGEWMQKWVRRWIA
jgi:nucleoside-diphosphate-sugar epimerase